MNIYMFPIANLNKSASKNPYIDNLIDTLENNNCFIINKEKINKFGVFDLLLYIHKTDIYYLNWIENLPDRRFGWIQAILFYFIFLILKILRKKVVWMMHNKISHSKKGLFFKIVTNYLLINYSDIVLTHSKDGIRFGNIFLKNSKKIEFRHHPIEKKVEKINFNEEKEIDILIWGSISPYKGIDRFLEYLKKSSVSSKYTIHIAGKVSNAELAKKLNQYANEKIIIEDNFISREKLEELFLKSKIVLFTYAGYSTLSSGALMDTLSYGKIIMGPHVGAFRDLKEEGLIDTFIDFDDLIYKLTNGLEEGNNRNENLISFIENNSWHKFSEFLCKILYEKG